MAGYTGWSSSNGGCVGRASSICECIGWPSSGGLTWLGGFVGTLGGVFDAPVGIFGDLFSWAATRAFDGGDVWSTVESWRDNCGFRGGWRFRRFWGVRGARGVRDFRGVWRRLGVDWLVLIALVVLRVDFVDLRHLAAILRGVLPFLPCLSKSGTEAATLLSSSVSSADDSPLMKSSSTSEPSRNSSSPGLASSRS